MVSESFELAAALLATASALPRGLLASAPRRPPPSVNPPLPISVKEAGETSARPDTTLAARASTLRKALVEGTRPRMSASSAAESCRAGGGGGR